MARVTVEDCVVLVPNRFELVMLAAHRARALASGAELKVERDRDKNPVVSLREIAEQKVDFDLLNESLVKSLQKRLEPDRPEEEVVELMASEQQSWINADLASEDSSDDDIDEEIEDDEDLEDGGPVDASDFNGTFEDTDEKA